LGEGIIIDTFMGSGSTVAAAEAVGVCCIGIERNLEYYQMSCTAIPKFITLETPTQKTTDLQLTLW
jgi:site-specific DNA-methyltransferase (adenine-specific)